MVGRDVTHGPQRASDLVIWASKYNQIRITPTGAVYYVDVYFEDRICPLRLWRKYHPGPLGAVQNHFPRLRKTEVESACEAAAKAIKDLTRCLGTLHGTGFLPPEGRPTEFHLDVRQSDNVLEDKHWCVWRLHFAWTYFSGAPERSGYFCKRRELLWPRLEGEELETAERQHSDDWFPGVGWPLDELREWHGQDYTGSFPEATNDVGRWEAEEVAGRFYHHFHHLTPAEEEALWGPCVFCDHCGLDVRDCDNPEHKEGGENG